MQRAIVTELPEGWKWRQGGKTFLTAHAALLAITYAPGNTDRDNPKIEWRTNTAEGDKELRILLHQEKRNNPNLSTEFIVEPKQGTPPAKWGL